MSNRIKLFYSREQEIHLLPKITLLNPLIKFRENAIFLNVSTSTHSRVIKLPYTDRDRNGKREILNQVKILVHFFEQIRSFQGFLNVPNANKTKLARDMGMPYAEIVSKYLSNLGLKEANTVHYRIYDIIHIGSREDCNDIHNRVKLIPITTQRN